LNYIEEKGGGVKKKYKIHTQVKGKGGEKKTDGKRLN